MPRFRVGKENDHVAILDEERPRMPAAIFLPNDKKPHGPRFMAEICVKALNRECEAAGNKKRK